MTDTEMIDWLESHRACVEAGDITTSPAIKAILDAYNMPLREVIVLAESLERHCYPKK